ncbi:DNA repair protein XRCC1 [Frankliniella fusca]|uniref:DNA repair protein XRCC1 n=1 Tax=Frankliniella fusca TaxID=407009 RepID=A0AAE1LE76_9NEOP|nr:DNA repair protein XRCC1 [Frankliniella fusca]
MVEVKPIDVCCSSQDPAFPAVNLVMGASKPSDERKQWLCSAPDEKFAYVTLTYEKPFVISSLEIKNNGSAYVQVEGGSSSEPGNYKVLWKTLNLMTPTESRFGMETEGIYLFLPQDLATSDKDKMWDVLKITCSQPFNKFQKYGLSHVIARSALPVKEEIPSSPSPCVGDLPLPGLKQEPVEDVRSNVEANKQLDKTLENQNQMSSEVSSSGCSETSTSLTSPVKQEDPSNDETYFSSPGRSEPSSSSVQQCDLQSPSVKREDPVPVTMADSQIPQTDTAEEVLLTGHSSPLKRRISETSSNSEGSSDEIQIIKRPAPNNITYKPFNRLLEGVKIVISGFQNPHRAEIRTRALALGAQYSPHWTENCTHLVCAFLYTPKYRQAALDNALIVTREWVDQCFQQRKRLPWRRFALNPSERCDDGNGVEIWELVPNPTRAGPNNDIGSTTSPASSSRHVESAPIHVICSSPSGHSPLLFRSTNNFSLMSPVPGVKREVVDNGECSSAHQNAPPDMPCRLGTPRPPYLPNICLSSQRQGITVKREINSEELQDMWQESSTSQHTPSSASSCGIESAQSRKPQASNTHHLFSYHSVPTASSSNVDHETMRSASTANPSLEAGPDGYAGYYRPISQPCAVPHSSPSATYLVPPVIMLPQTLPQYFVPVSQQFQAPPPARETYMARSISSPQVQSQHIRVIQHSNKAPSAEEETPKQS